MKNIKKIVSIILIRYKYSPKKINKELDNVKHFIKKSSIYVGKKKKLYTFITSQKVISNKK